MTLAITIATIHDASGNRLLVLDPNGMRQDCVCNALGRDTSCTDSVNVTTGARYDNAGNQIVTIDGKNYETKYAFDGRGRQVFTTDRLGGSTVFSSRSVGHLASHMDAVNQVTS